MSRLPILTLLAVPGLLLAACDQPSPLAKAKPGECYTVVGKDSAGTKLAKTACAGSPAAIAAACPAPTTPALPGPQGAGAACPSPEKTVAASGATVAPSVFGSTGVKTAGASRTVTHRSVRKDASQRRVQVVRRDHAATTRYVWRDDEVAKSGEVTPLHREYARVDQDLAGGPSDYQGHGSAYRGQGTVYQNHGSAYQGHGSAYQGHGSAYRGKAYESRERYSRVERSAPPVRFSEKREYHGGYVQAPPPPPPPAPRIVERSQHGGSVQYSERSSASRAYSSSYSSSASSSYGGYGAAQCDCDDRSPPPRSPFDGNGFLTWRNKTPG